MTRRAPHEWPVCTSNCADCAVGTMTLGEYYMVRDRVWEQAWRGRRKSWHGQIAGQEILCIGCLEQRIGRTLMASDFIDAPVNDPNKPNISERLRNRLTDDCPDLLNSLRVATLERAGVDDAGKVCTPHKIKNLARTHSLKARGDSKA